MTLTRHLIATLAVSLMLFGCSKDEKKSDKPAAEKASKVAAESSDSADRGAARKQPAKSENPAKAPKPDNAPTPAPVAGTAASAAGFEMFRKDMNLVFGMNFNSFRSNQAYAMARPMLMAALAKESGGEYGKYTGACGFDPIESVHSVMLGGVIDGEDDFLFVVSGIDKPRLQKCILGMAKAAGDEIKVSDDGNLTTFQPTSDEPLRVAWKGDSTLLFAPELSKELLLERAAGKDGMSGNEVMTELLSKVDTEATMWAATTPPDKAQEDMPIKFRGMHGSLGMSDGLLVKLSFLTEGSAEAEKGAKQLEKSVQEGLAQMKGNPMAAMANRFVTKLSIKPDGSYISLELNLNAEEYQQLLAMGQSFAQMAGGM